MTAHLLALTFALALALPSARALAVNATLPRPYQPPAAAQPPPLVFARTLPPRPLAAILVPPRVCGGRITRQEAIRAFYDQADRPVRAMLDAYGWACQ